MTTVYLVDDDPLVTDSLGTALRLETSYGVHVFQTGPAALVAIAEHPPDVVITDFKMPGMDGLTLLRAVRQAVPDAVLMLLTGYADKESAIQAINQVAIYQYVEKPWNLDDLLLKIRSGLERRDLVRKLREANADLARQNAELARAQDQLVAQERLAAVGRVVSGLAHEIGNQLALVGYAEAIKAKAGAGSEIGELADVIVAAQKRLAAMVSEIKDFVRVGQGEGRPLALEPADVGAIVEEALGILRYDRDVGARKVIHDLRARPLARLDRGKFAQVVINLVRNAAQATPLGGRIVVSLDDAPVRLVVADEGTGMAPEVLDRLGEPFFSTRGDSGSGLGLGISRRIVAEHGGAMDFESWPGKGTRVTVTLPGLAA